MGADALSDAQATGERPEEQERAVKVVTNQGTNVPASVLARYPEIVLAPQKIVGGSRTHDTREPLSPDAIDAWVADCDKLPAPIGSNAGELAAIFKQLLDDGEGQILSVQTSRKVVQSYNAAIAARRTLLGDERYASATIEVFDTGMTDLGTLFGMLYALELVRDGRSLADAHKLGQQMTAQGHMLLLLHTLDRMVASGRASFLRATLANALKIRPVISFVDGELKPVGTYALKEGLVEACVRNALERVPEGTPVWLGVAHGHDLAEAQRLHDALSSHYDVRFSMVRQLTPTSYLVAGSKALSVFLFPLDGVVDVPALPALSGA